jgi:hypothetical protein
MVGFSGDEVSTLAGRLEGGRLELASFPGYGCRFVLDYSFTVVEAPDWVEESVRAYLEAAYRDRGYPWWVVDYVNSTGFSVNVKWVELRGFYSFLYGLARSYLESEGVLYRDVLVFLGDLDGVSRQYWAEARYGYVMGGALLLEGVRGWSGQLPLTFYDLTVIPKPRPESDMPILEGIPVDYTTEPPIWDLRAEGRVADYLAELAVDHVRFRVAGSRAPASPATTPLEIRYSVFIVSFGSEDVLEEILSMLGEEEVARLTRTLVPWARISVAITVVDASEIEGLAEYVAGLAPDGEGFINLEYERIAGMLGSFASAKAGGGEPFKLTYVFFVLATSEPSRFKFNDMLFTGFSHGYWGATSWPGHGYRNYEGGLPRTIVHELGHSLGEAHPFEYRGPQSLEIRWLMDWSSTVMSYDDSIIAGFLEGSGTGYLPDYYTVYREGLRYAGALALYMADKGVIQPEEARKIMEKAARDPVGAAVEAAVLYYSTVGGGTATVTVTETETETLRETATVYETRTVTKTEERVVYVTTTVDKLVEETIVETITVTETVHSTVTVTLESQAASTYVLVAVLAAVLALLAALALARPR